MENDGSDTHYADVASYQDAAARARAQGRRVVGDYWPAQAGGGNDGMTAATGETTTYKGWTDWAEDAIGQLTALRGELDNWCAQIAADDGDQSQIDAIHRWQSELEAVASDGQRMVDGVATTQVPVGEAVQAAGGSDNTPHKQYADEARPR